MVRPPLLLPCSALRCGADDILWCGGVGAVAAAAPVNDATAFDAAATAAVCTESAGGVRRRRATGGGGTGELRWVRPTPHWAGLAHTLPDAAALAAPHLHTNSAYHEQSGVMYVGRAVRRPTHWRRRARDRPLYCLQFPLKSSAPLSSPYGRRTSVAVRRRQIKAGVPCQVHEQARRSPRAACGFERGAGEKQSGDIRRGRGGRGGLARSETQ